MKSGSSHLTPRRRTSALGPEIGRRFPKAAAVESQDLALAIHALYEKVESSDSFFASPLGPVAVGGESLWLPQFVYFGPKSGGEPVRLVLLSGTRKADQNGSNALLEWITSLLENPDAGHAPGISVFPVVNVRELLTKRRTVDLGREDWRRSAEPEIVLLRENARLRRYRGFIRVSATSKLNPEAVVRSVFSRGTSVSNVEIFSGADFDPFGARFESILAGDDLLGPLGLFQEDGFPHFEVELSLPSKWSAGQWAVELVPLVWRIVTVYRHQIAIAGGL